MNDSSDICSVSVGAGLFGWFLNLGGKSEDDLRQEVYLSVVCIFPLFFFSFYPKASSKDFRFEWSPLSSSHISPIKKKQKTSLLPFHFLEQKYRYLYLFPLQVGKQIG